MRPLFVLNSKSVLARLLQAPFSKPFLHRCSSSKVIGTVRVVLTRMPRNRGTKSKVKKRKKNCAKVAKGGWGYAAAAPLDVDDEEFHDASGPAAEEDEDEDEFHDASSEDEGAAGFHDVVTDEQRRASIAVAFIDVFNAAPKCEWGGVDGTVSLIMAHLGVPRGSRDVVYRVLNDVVQCHLDGVEYSSDRKAGQGGQAKLIKLGSI